MTWTASMGPKAARSRRRPRAGHRRPRAPNHHGWSLGPLPWPVRPGTPSASSPGGCAVSSGGRGSVRPVLITLWHCAAHRRCAYTWTSQHTWVAGMQVRRTKVDASVSRGTGWWGSNPGTPASPHPSEPGRLDPAARRSPDRPPRAIIPCGTSRCRAPRAA
jgi:hypothetical protein